MGPEIMLISLLMVAAGLFALAAYAFIKSRRDRLRRDAAAATRQ